MSLSWERWTTVSQGSAPPGSLVTAVPFGQSFAVFITDPNGGVYAKAGTPGSPCGGWGIVGDPFRAKPGSPVTAVPWGDRFALFVTDKNGGVFTIEGDPQRGFPGDWATVSQGSAPPGSLVNAVPFGQSIAVFITDPNGGVYANAGTPGAPYGDWAIVGDPFRAKPGSPVTAVPWGDRFALFVTDKSGEVFTIEGDPQRGFPGDWATVSQGSAPPGSLVTAVPFGQSFAVFITDPNGGVYANAGTPGAPFGDWGIVGDPFRAAPGSPITAVPWGDGFALFVTDKNGEVFTTAGDPQRGFPGGWTTVSQGSALPGSPVTAVLVGQNIAVFIADPNGGIYTTLGGPFVMPPRIASTTIYGPNGDLIASINGQAPLTIGLRYTVAVKVVPGSFPTYTVGVVVNSALPVPASLNVLNRVVATGFVPETEGQTRRFAFAPSQPGSFPLGFQLQDQTGAFSAGDTIRVSCSATDIGLYGQVTSRLTGAPIAGASIGTSNLSTVSASDGSWHLATANGGPLQVVISKPGYSSTVAVNVSVPPSSGVRIDTPLEDPFSALTLAGVTYTTYIDYSRGRTILHTVRMNPLSSSGIVSLAQAPDLSAGVTLHDIATAQNSLVIINGGYFDGTGRSLGYLYTNGFANPEVLGQPSDTFAQPGPPNVIEPANILPMLTVAGDSVRQQIDIVHSESDFESMNSSEWRRDSEGNPIWALSDVSYAVQVGPTLLMNSLVIWGGEFDVVSGYLQYFPRTAVGVGPGTGGSNTLYLVVADGEGVNGGNGATHNQLGEFFRDILGATAAMNFDGGESTQMVLQGVSGQRTVNMLTSENNEAPDGYVPSGVVASYLKIGI